MLFAVVASGLEQGRVLGFARYQRIDKSLHKISTQLAREKIAAEYPAYVYRSAVLDVELPGIPLTAIRRHYQPQAGLQTCRYPFVHEACAIFKEHECSIGITGSYLVGANTSDSDLDIVVYGLESFAQARRLVGDAIASGVFQSLGKEQWYEAYRRRGETALEFDEYVRHENRKKNKFSFQGVKVDVSCVAPPHNSLGQVGKKRGLQTIQARIKCDRYGFASPAVYEIEHDTVQTILINSATYVGQARRGELVEATGMVETTEAGQERLVVGSSRECPHEYLRVVELHAR